MAETKVKMYSQVLDETRPYDISHAQRLLDLEKKLGNQQWELKDKNFTLDNGTIKRTDTGTDKAAGKQKPNSQGN